MFDYACVAAERLRQLATNASERNRWVRFFGARAEEWIYDLDEIVNELGDGAVAVKRGKLEGVTDTTVLHFSHMAVTKDDPSPVALQIRELVVQRLKSETR